VSADDERTSGDARRIRRRDRARFRLERVHRRDADEPGTLLQVVLDRTAEAKIDERDVVAARFERGGDVLHAERLDAEEAAETEAFVSRDGTKQQHTHGSTGQINTRCYTPVRFMSP
jgi:hypothetical protein